MSEAINQPAINRLPMPTGARVAGERMAQKLKRLEKSDDAFEMIRRVELAHRMKDEEKLALLMIESLWLLAKVGGES